MQIRLRTTTPRSSLGDSGTRREQMVVRPGPNTEDRATRPSPFGGIVHSPPSGSIVTITSRLRRSSIKLTVVLSTSPRIRENFVSGVHLTEEGVGPAFVRVHLLEIRRYAERISSGVASLESPRIS